MKTGSLKELRGVMTMAEKSLVFNAVDGSNNVAVATDGKFTYLRYENDVQGTPSATGKSMVIASTHGNQDVAGTKIGLNVFRKIAK